MAGTRGYPYDVPTLADGEIILRAHRLSDLDPMVEQCVDPDSIRWTTAPVPYSRADAVMFATKLVPAGWAAEDDFGFAVEAPYPDGVGRYAGTVSLARCGDGVGQIAYGLHPAVRGRGVCRRAVRLLVDWGFHTLGLDVVLWRAAVGNWASRRVAWAEGFSFDGSVPGLLSQRGERRDAWIGSLRAGDTREPKYRWNVAPVLVTERLRLRELTEADADRFGEMLFDERSRHFGGRVPGVLELKTGAEALLRSQEGCARGERYEWAVADRETDRIVGRVQLFDLGGLDPTEAKPGYVIHQDSRGRGYLAEALSAVTEWAFRPVTGGGLGKRRISLTTAASNKASRHGAERAGYTHVATEPDAFPVGDTGFDDMVVYHRLNPDWVRADPG